MRVLAVILKNTAALDYALPVLWALKRAQPEADVSVLYCRLSKGEIVRDAGFYSEVLREAGIREYDYADFLPWPLRLGRGLVRGWLARSLRDRPGAAKDTARREHWRGILEKRVRKHRLMETLSPDVVLMDHTSAPIEDKAFVQAYLKAKQCPVVLLPHAPHHTGTEAFVPFSEEQPLPGYADFWMPFAFDQTWKALPERRDQFFHAGYPGLDSEWLQFCLNRRPPGKRSEDRPLRCLFVIRRFWPEGRARKPNDNEFIYQYEDMRRYLDVVVKAVQAWSGPIEVIVKPHPSNNRYRVEALMRGTALDHWSVTYEPIYALLPRIDCVVSLYSTVLLVAAMAGIPVALLHTTTQSYIHQWPDLERMYTGLEHYYSPPEAFAAAAAAFFNQAASPEQRRGSDVRNLREFFPDQAVRQAVHRVTTLV